MLVMNSTHVDLLGGEDSAQASAISILLYLLVESNFTRSSHLRSTTRDHLEQIDDLLLTALYPAVGGRASTFRGFPTDALTKLRAALTSSVVSVATPTGAKNLRILQICATTLLQLPLAMMATHSRSLSW
ncbi:hypothetical protein [Leucobacter soli]|uniref:hypothetical protein n=1 Tax=Leucobacter soli TaxID=2812850 RepID=UPI00360837F9